MARPERPLQLVIAPDAFKGSLEARAVAEAIAAGCRRALPDAVIRCFPLADGGEGTVASLLAARGGRLRGARVHGPLGEPVEASYAILPDGAAVIELAAASGLPLLPAARRDPLRASSFGTGELVRDALDQGCRRLIVGLGGSAVNDGGLGLLQALGFRFLDAKGQSVGPGGGALGAIARIDVSQADPRLRDAQLIAATDVDNPLLGPEGATHTFGPQKGATPAMLETLEAGMRHYADKIAETLAVRVHDLPGAGAAGGCGAALHAFLGAEIRSGVALVMEALGVTAALAGADLLITGEGRIDGQTRRGKAPYGVARLAKRHGVPVLMLAGAVTPEARTLLEDGICDVLLGIPPAPMSLEIALAHTAQHLADGAEQLLRAYRLGRRSG